MRPLAIAEARAAAALGGDVWQLQCGHRLFAMTMCVSASSISSWRIRASILFICASIVIYYYYYMNGV
jgi:hypothetical protein